MFPLPSRLDRSKSSPWHIVNVCSVTSKARWLWSPRLLVGVAAADEVPTRQTGCGASCYSVQRWERVLNAFDAVWVAGCGVQIVPFLEATSFEMTELEAFASSSTLCQDGHIKLPVLITPGLFATAITLPLGRTEDSICGLMLAQFNFGYWLQFCAQSLASILRSISFPVGKRGGPHPG